MILKAFVNPYNYCKCNQIFRSGKNTGSVGHYIIAGASPTLCNPYALPKSNSSHFVI